jgi:hypothetical protein
MVCGVVLILAEAEDDKGGKVDPKLTARYRRKCHWPWMLESFAER